MPTEAQLNTDPTPKPKPKGKGKALGIPKWGWIAALAIGLVIGYILLRKSSSAGGSNPAPETSGNPSAGESGAGQSSGDGGGGAIGVPPNFLDYLKAIGVSGGQSSQTSAPPSTNSPAQATAPSDSAAQPGPSDPAISGGTDSSVLLGSGPGSILSGVGTAGAEVGSMIGLPNPPGPVAGSGLAGLILPGVGEAGKAMAPYAGPVGPSSTPPLPKGKVAD